MLFYYNITNVSIVLYNVNLFFVILTLGSSIPDRSGYSSLVIIKAAKLAVYIAIKTNENRAQILDKILKRIYHVRQDTDNSENVRKDRKHAEWYEISKPSTIVTVNNQITDEIF